jgi:cbb3-type cytochrome c oxidase subunit III
MGTGLAASLWWAVPGEGTNSAVERGRGLYALHCAACHGADGEGRARGNATSLNNPDFLAAAGDAFLRATIARGRCGTEMRAWAQAAGGPLRPAEIEEVIAFLRSWQRDVPQRPAPRAGRGDPTHGRKVYEAACASCHGWEGKGELGMGPALSNPDFLATADDAFLWATVAYGRRDTPMFPSLRGLDGVRQFSEAEIDDLVAYLRSWQGGTPDEHDSALE